MSRWVSKEDWARAKGSVSQQLKDKDGPKVRLGRAIVKRAGRLGLAGPGKGKKPWKGKP
jgi:hypothetical protein